MGRRENAPIRMYADEEKIRTLVKYWDEDVKGHQRALARISPMFRSSILMRGAQPSAQAAK